MIAILGGGIAGSSLAWALTRRGERDVEVWDPNPPGFGSTVRATGGFRVQFASKLNVELSLAARPFFVEHADEIGFKPNGYAFIASDKPTVKRLADWRNMQTELGLPVEQRDSKKLFPALTFNGVRDCNYCRLDGVFNPSRLLALLHGLATDQGARFHWGESFPVTSSAPEAVVIAAGCWSTAVAQQFDVEVEVITETRIVRLLSGIDLSPTMPLGIDLDGGWVFRERAGNLLVVSGAGGGDARALIADWISRRTPQPEHLRVVDEWEGRYEITRDHHPYVGESGKPNVWLSCGFSGHGIMHAPAIGDSLAAMILGDSPSVDISPLGPGRSDRLVDATQI